MPRHFRSAIAAAVFSTVLCFASAAFAQASQWQSVDVTADDSESGAFLMVSGVLPENATLPAQVELSVPAGADLIWVGEVLGGPAEDDPAVKAVKTTKDGIDVYSFTLAEARRGQVEVSVPPAAAFDGSRYAASLKWSSSQTVPTVRLSVRMPQGSSVVQPAEDAALEPAGDGSSYYTRPFENVKAGDSLAMSFAYTVASPAAGVAPATRPASSTAVPVVLGLGALAAAVALIVGVSHKMSTKSAARADIDDPLDRSESSDTDDSESDRGTAQSEAGEGAEKARPRRLSPVAIMLLAAGAFVAAAAITVNLASAPQIAEGKITKSFGGEASACTSTTIAVSPTEGVDLARSGEKLLDSFSGIQGIGAVTLYVADEPRVEVQFCESATSEQAIRNALGTTGLVTF